MRSIARRASLASAAGLAIVMATSGLLASASAASRTGVSSFGGTSRPSCPSTLAPGATAASGVVAAVQRDMPSLYNRVPGHEKYKIVAMYALARGPQSDAIKSVVAAYRGIASHRCGPTVADRSWVVLLYLPYFKSSASMSEGVVYAARTRGGWHVWYVYH